MSVPAVPVLLLMLPVRASTGSSAYAGISADSRAVTSAITDTTTDIT